VKTRKLTIACPGCGSDEVLYTCTPNCCFNHVCAKCGATFETATSAAGGALTGVQPPEPPPEATDPAAPCARCDAVAVYLLEDGGAVCGACGALLRIEITPT
jgi:hypothetical protein